MLSSHAESCTRSFCINCNDQHSALDKECPRFIQMREILKIKTENYCSMGVAQRKYRERNPSVAQGIGKSNTYAAVAPQNKPSKPLTPNPSNEKLVLPSTKNYTAKPVSLPAKDNIEKIKTTAIIGKIKTTTRIPKSNKLSPTEPPALKSVSYNVSNLSCLNQPSISKYTRAPTRYNSNVRNHLNTGYSARKNKLFT
ncbi:uncharacterized protein ACN427_013586 isoform 1-T1 [Glossina fuscipes fuscipes]